MEGYLRATIEINKKALQHNITILKAKIGRAKLVPILKANAYGHGLVTVARAIQDRVDGFGVACVGEALQLRQAGFQGRIIVLEGALSVEEYATASLFKLDMVIHQEYHYHWLTQYPPLYPITIWLKVNTGMNRLGFSPHQVEPLIRKLKASSLTRSIILMSHLASADKLENSSTLLQQETFNQLIQGLPFSLTYSLANSAALLESPDTHYHWVRPGLAIYGTSPFINRKGTDYHLQPVMTIRSKIIAIQQLQPGDAIGYYGRDRCQDQTRVGIVSFGYGDGYPYNAPKGMSVLWNQRRLPLIGQVSMDMLTIDITTQPAVKVGDEVVLWGQGILIEEIAQMTHRSCYELLCGVQRDIKPRLSTKLV